MRQGSNSGRRPRGRPNRKQHGSPRNSTVDSNGPDGRIRGSASQIYEKYMALARDATSSGDRIIAESYFQHAEHYFRVMNENAESRSGQDFQGRRGRRDGQQDQRADSVAARGSPEGKQSESDGAGKAEAITMIVPEGGMEAPGTAESAIQVLSPTDGAKPGEEARSDADDNETTAQQPRLDSQTTPNAEEGSATNGTEPPKQRRRRGRPPKAKKEEAAEDATPADTPSEA